MGGGELGEQITQMHWQKMNDGERQPGKLQKGQLF